MNKFKFYFIAFLSLISFFSCDKDENTIQTVPLKDYKEQFKADSTQIVNYLKTHYITVKDNRGSQDDQDVTITFKDPSDMTHVSIWDQTIYELKNQPVSFHGIEYNIYYLVLRQGSKNLTTDKGGVSPSNTDSVLTSYSGSYLKETTNTEGTTLSANFFEESKYPTQYFNLLSVVKGWSEVFPQFKTGWYEGNEEDGSISFYDFGAGVIFIPSGLAYYNTGAGSIPGYSPLVFSFKLYEIARNDTDGDGLYNHQEDIDGDNYMYSFVNKINYPKYTGIINVDKEIWFKDDTDQDGIPNFLDIDDDGDGFSTKFEIEKGSDYLNKLDVPN